MKNSQASSVRNAFSSQTEHVALFVKAAEARNTTSNYNCQRQILHKICLAKVKVATVGDKICHIQTSAY